MIDEKVWQVLLSEFVSFSYYPLGYCVCKCLTMPQVDQGQELNTSHYSLL